MSPVAICCSGRTAQTARTYSMNGKIDAQQCTRQYELAPPPGCERLARAGDSRSYFPTRSPKLIPLPTDILLYGASAADTFNINGSRPHPKLQGTRRDELQYQLGDPLPDRLGHRGPDRGPRHL